MKLLSRIKKILPLIIILVLALSLRLIDISRNPPALYGDELTLVYDAYSILKTGHDQTGAFLPLTFSMSEGRPPFYVYASVPLVALFGPTALSARLLSVFSGVGIVFLLYLLLMKLSSKKVALVAALFAAISPWDLSLSRGGFETHLALFFSLLGITALIFARQKKWFLFITAFSFGLAIHTYHSYKVVLPLLLPVLLWFVDWKSFFIKKRDRTYFILSAIIMVLFLSIWLYQVKSGSEVRFQNTSIFNQQELAATIVQKVNLEQSLDTSFLSRLTHNKFEEYLGVLGNNYFSHFSFDFLFLHGDGNPRHNQALMGEMYLVDAILVLLGLTLLFWQNRKFLLFLLAWILIAPLATIVVSPAHALRSTFLLPPLLILSALGFVFLAELAQKKALGKILFLVVVIGLFFQFIILIDRIYILYPKQFAHFWSYSAKIASEEAAKQQKNYDYVILSDGIDSINTAFPVYAIIDPQKFINQNSQKVQLGDRAGFKIFNNIYLGAIPTTEVNNLIDSLKGKILYIGGAEEAGKIQNYHTIYGSDGLPILVEVTKN